MNTTESRIGAYLELCKIKISFFSTLSAATGFLLVAPSFPAEILLLLGGVFMLACGASGLNQFQERRIDAHMERTRQRPVPSGRISPFRALLFSLLLIVSGLLVLAFAGRTFVAILGLCGVLWYNGLYTWLKRKTAFAVIPGALVGAVPPAMGWLFGNGDFADPKLLALCFFFFMWQVPHFWILLLRYGEEYEKAGLPSLSGIFSRNQIARITSHWIYATAASSLLVFLFGLVRSPLTVCLLLAVSSGFLWQGIELARTNSGSDSSGYAVFKKINYCTLAIVVLISLDRVSCYIAGSI